MIRNATLEDLPGIQSLYAQARRFMADNGNPTQWAGGYPWEDMLLEDIARGELFVLEEDSLQGVFAFIIGEDPTYRRIEGGQWLSDRPYGTIHRLAGDGKSRGVLARTVAFCEGGIPHLRIDTHHDNTVMRHLIPKNGFQECGIIYQPDGTPRIAYEKLGEGEQP